MSNVWDVFGDDETAARRIAEWLLIESLGDLEHRCREGATTYERLGASAVLRRLLMDKRPILHRARARLSLPEPVFRFTPHEKPYERPEAKLRLAIAFGSSAKEPRAATGNLEAFLASAGAHSFGEPVTIKEVIRQFAHTYGGVHLGSPETKFERLVQRAGSVMSLDAMGWSNALAGIAQVTIEAITPVAEALIAHPYPPPEGVGHIPSAAEIAEMRARGKTD